MDLALWMAKRMMIGVYMGRQKGIRKSPINEARSLGNGEALQSKLMQGDRDCHATDALEL